MVRVEITLVPSDGSPERLLGRGKIVNTGEGTNALGTYRVELEKSPEYAKASNVGNLWRKGRVQRFPRLRLGPWDLLFRALLAAVGDRNMADVADELARFNARNKGGKQ